MGLIEIIGITTVASSSIITGAIYLFRNSIFEKIKSKIKHDYDKKLEKHKSDLNKEIELFKREIREEEQQKLDKWKLKQQACYEALELADNLLSNYDWDNIDSNQFVKGDVDTKHGRSVYNKLATTCDSSDILELLKQIIKVENIDLGIVVDFRNEVRKELGFGEIIDTDKKTSFFGRLKGDNS